MLCYLPAMPRGSRVVRRTKIGEMLFVPVIDLFSRPEQFLFFLRYSGGYSSDFEHYELSFSYINE
jgi:hypothetical protein